MLRSPSTSSILMEQEVNESHLYNQDRDVLYVCVVRGKRTSLFLCFVQWFGSLVAYSLVADAGVPPGSEVMFVSQLLLFFSCWLFLLFPLFPQLSQTLSKLVLVVSAWAFVISLLLFFSAAATSNAFEQCTGLDVKTTHVCSKLQGAISITFICSFTVMGSFIILVLGFIKPPEMTFKMYVQSNFPVRIRNQESAENIPLGVIRSSDGGFFNSVPTQGAPPSPLPPPNGPPPLFPSKRRVEAEENLNVSTVSVEDGEETGKSLDGLDII